MTADLKPYPHYKPSGVEWLGDIPAHWEVRRLKWVASLNPSKTEARTFLTADTPVTFLPMERVGTDGEIDEKRASASAVWNGFTYFRRNDVLVAKITPCFENGKGACLDALSTEIGFGSTEFHVLRAGSSISPQFLYRLTTLAQFRHSGAEEMTGAAGQKRVPKAFVANYPLPLPPLAEQAAIVRYLDHTDGRIRRYLRSRERLIELLKEYRQATIHETVTRGLDPDVPLKPSGVEWLGDIPAHWEVRRVKHAFRRIVGGSTPSSSEAAYWDGTIIWVTPTDISKVTRLRDSQRRITKKGFDSCSTTLVPVGSLVVTSRAPVGNVALAEVPLCTNQGCKSLIPESRVMDSNYGYQVFGRLRDELQSLANGTTFTEISTNALGNVSLPIPPLAEQAAIAAYLDKQTAAITAAMTRAQREFELLSEYRTRLIADVVTGQVDVREATD